jgi:hypothetical protein
LITGEELMKDTPAPERTIRGSVKEILEQIKTLPADRQGLFELLPEEAGEIDDREHERLLGVWDRFFAKADALEFERPTTSPSPYEQAIIEKYRKQGLKI